MSFHPSPGMSMPTPNIDLQPVRKPIRKHVEPFFFNPRLKLAALRLALFSSAVALGAGAMVLDVSYSGNQRYLIVVGIVLAHHLLSAFKFRLLFRLLDFIFLVAELVLLIYDQGPATVGLGRFTPTGLIVVFVAGWGLVVTLFFLLLCRVAAIIRHKGRNLLKPFDMLEDAQRIKGIPIANCPAAYSLLIGRSIWRIQFVGEGLPVRLIRGCIAGSFIAAVIGYAVIAIIIKPVKETALLPVKESRGEALTPGEENQPRVWNFAFSRRMYTSMNSIPGLNSSERFQSAVTVTPLWDDRVDEKPPCIHLPGIIPVPKEKEKVLQIIHVRCPGRTGPTNLMYRSDYMPDILIEVNYEPIAIDPDVEVGLFEGVVGVYAGFTNDPMYLTRKSQSIPLPPSSHFLATIGIEIRKVLKHPVLSALGMFETQNTFSIPRISHIVPDPLAQLDPPVYNMSRSSSTFRIFYHIDISEVRIVEDEREKSILGGFSAIGGLWTFLGGIFALFFGTTLMKIFFDTKELSIFGLAQQLEKDKIARAYLQEYPRIRQELSLPPSQRGIMTLLQDHMVDVELFKEAIEDEQTPKETLMNAYDVEELGTTPVIPQHIQEVRTE